MEDTAQRASVEEAIAWKVKKALALSTTVECIALALDHRARQVVSDSGIARAAYY